MIETKSINTSRYPDVVVINCYTTDVSMHARKEMKGRQKKCQEEKDVHLHRGIVSFCLKR